MRAAIIVFHGSNCDRDIYVALASVGGIDPIMVRHAETSLPTGTDLIVLPGGFSHGDYLRPGAMAGRAPIIPALKKHAETGGYILGICNGFQILTEIGLLPGTLLRNARLRFICRSQKLRIAGDSVFTTAYDSDITSMPIAHGDGNFYAPTDTLDRLEDEERIAFRYPDNDNPNGSAHNIAGILSSNRRVLGMMPHPERAVDPALEGGVGGVDLFNGLAAA